MRAICPADQQFGIIYYSLDERNLYFALLYSTNAIGDEGAELASSLAKSIGEGLPTRHADA